MNPLSAMSFNSVKFAYGHNHRYGEYPYQVVAEFETPKGPVYVLSTGRGADQFVKKPGNEPMKKLPKPFYRK